MTMLAIVYYLLFVVKTCCQDWGQLYLLEERGVTESSASSYHISYEFGGLVGSILLGALTDFITRRGYYSDQKMSPRIVMVQIATAGAAMFLNLFIFIMDDKSTKVSCCFRCVPLDRLLDH